MEMRLLLNHTGYNLFELQNGDADESHTHDCFQLSIPLNGSLLVQHNHKTMKLSAQEGLIVAPGDIHQHEAVGERKKILLIGVTEEILCKAFTQRTGYDLKTIDFKNIQLNPKKQLLSHVNRIFQTASFKAMDELIDLEDALVCLFLDQMDGSHSEIWNKHKKDFYFNETSLVRGIESYISNQFHHALSLDKMATDLHVSKYHLHRSFTKAKGMTPMDYLHKVRLEKVKQLILIYNQDIASAAFQVGYQTLSTFNRAFKKYNGQTPSDFIKANR